MADIKLLATDLDGTLIGSINEFPLYSDFKRMIEDLKASDDTAWVACTGRGLSSFREFFSPMRSMGITPDYIIVSHAYIFSLTKYGYMPHMLWNMMIHYRIWVGKLHVQGAIDEWYDMITGVALGITTVRRRKNRLRLRFDSEESAMVAADLLSEKIKPFKQLKVFRYLREVEVRTVPYTKGLAVSELARHLGIKRDNILAIGDGHNDASMLDGTVAVMTGCPSNSEAEIIETVSKAEGHIAASRALAGVLEIIEAYINGRVNSSLPEDWNPEIHSQNHRKPRKSSRGEGGRRKRRLMAAVVFAGVAYAVALMFAHWGLIPYGMSPIIEFPFNFVVNALEKIVVWFSA